MPAIPWPDEKPTLKIVEAAEILNISRTAAYRSVKDGHIPTVQVTGRKIVVPTASLRAMLGLPIERDAR